LGNTSLNGHLGGISDHAVKSKVTSVAGSARKLFPSAICAGLQWDGDYWRISLTQPALALRVAVFVRAGLRAGLTDDDPSCDARIAIGVADDATHMPGFEGLHDDPASAVAMRVFASMKKERLGIDDPSRNMRFRHALRTICTLVDAKVSTWTPRQALAITGVLNGMTQDAIRALWSPPLKNQSVVARHLDRAAWDAIRTALDFMERSAYNS